MCYVYINYIYCELLQQLIHKLFNIIKENVMAFNRRTNKKCYEETFLRHYSDVLVTSSVGNKLFLKQKWVSEIDDGLRGTANRTS